MHLTSYNNVAKAGLKRLLSSRLAETLAAPHGVERYMELVDPLWSISDVRAAVVSVEREAPDCVTVTLRPNDNWNGFVAGQYVQVGVEIDAVRRTRCFSISSSEHRSDGLITITVKAQTDGYVSRFLVERAQPGDVVVLSQAAGDFVLPDEHADKLLLISGGSGITPAMSMLRSLLDTGDTRPITFLHYARDYDNLIFGAELDAIAEQFPHVRVVRALTRAEPESGDLTGHFSPEHITEIAPDFAECAAFACGPAPLIGAVEELWQAEGVAHRLQVEFFQAAPAVLPENTDEIAGEIRFARSERVAENNGQTLLEQAESAGLSPAYGCRMGICQTCTCRKTAGTVRNLNTGELSSDTDTDIQICVSAPVGDVTLDL